MTSPLLQTTKRSLLMLAAATMLLIAGAPQAQEPMSPGKYKAPMQYALMLPPYCQRQYFNKEGDQYRIPKKTCGGGMNHFCPGLVYLLQARTALPKEQKYFYRRAKNEFEYTIRAMERQTKIRKTTCPISNHVYQAYEEAKSGYASVGGVN